MPDHPYYKSAEWRELREQRIRLDGYRCTVKGCTTPTYRLTVDHIERRRDGQRVTVNDLRTFCGHHDSQVKELPSGQRRNNGKPYVKGSDASGRPLDPSHPWHARQAH
jgi:5-methylcytosine-specific restriction endonuclease McrA